MDNNEMDNNAASGNLVILKLLHCAGKSCTGLAMDFAAQRAAHGMLKGGTGQHPANSSTSP